MNLKEVRIVFMGTPDFAVASLRSLHEVGVNIVAVITAPDRMGGRGRKQVITSAVKQYAITKQFKVLQPTNLKSSKFREELAALKPDLQVVVAFRMLPEVIWSLPPLGTINLHGSLLPAYRGAAPINWAIIKGETQTGVTTFFIRSEIDTGNILAQSTLEILPDDTAGSLHDRMMLAGAALVCDTVKLVVSGQAKPKQQDHSLATKAPKIFHEMCEIDFRQPVQKVYDFIRGLSPHPVAWTILDNHVLKLRQVDMEKTENKQIPGQIKSSKKKLMIGAENGWINIKELQLEGRRVMDVETFLNGYDLTTSQLKMSIPRPSLTSRQ